MNPRTVIYLMHFTDDDPDHAVMADFERPGEITDRAQFLSWIRDQGIAFPDSSFHMEDESLNRAACLCVATMQAAKVKDAK